MKTVYTGRGCSAQQKKEPVCCAISRSRSSLTLRGERLAGEGKWLKHLLYFCDFRVSWGFGLPWDIGFAWRCSGTERRSCGTLAQPQLSSLTTTLLVPAR